MRRPWNYVAYGLLAVLVVAFVVQRYFFNAAPDGRDTPAGDVFAAVRPGVGAPPGPPGAPGRSANDGSDEGVQQASFETEVKPPEPKKYTWTEMEALLERLRAERTQRPLAMHELLDWYERLSMPEFTQSQDYPQHFERLATWKAEVPNSPTRLVVLARTYIRYAWEARGSGFAYTVTEEGWENFHLRISEARRLLEQAFELGVKDGEAHRQLIIAGMAESVPNEQLREWVREGQRLDPQYYWIHTAMANNLLPRWQGEPGDIERFAAEIVEELPGDDGLDAYAHIAWTIATTERRILAWGKFDRELLAKSAEVMARRYADSSRLVHFAAFCTHLAQDHDAAQRIRPAVGEFRAEDGVWAWPNELQEFQTWCESPQVAGGEDHFFWSTNVTSRGIAFDQNTDRIWCSAQYGASPMYCLDLQSGELEAPFLESDGTLGDAVFDVPRGLLLGTFWRGTFTGWKLHDLATGETTSHETADMVRAIALDPQRRRVAWAQEKTVQMLDLDTGEAGPEYESANHVHGLTFSDDGALLVVRTNKTELVDAATGKQKFLLLDRSKNPALEWQVWNALGCDAEGRVWAVLTPAQTGKHPDRLVRFAADGKSWETLLPKLPSGISTLSHDRRLFAVAHQPHSGLQTTAIEVWSVPAKQKIADLPGHWNRINEAEFSPDGRKLATVAGVGLTKIWSLPAAPQP